MNNNVLNTQPNYEINNVNNVQIDNLNVPQKTNNFKFSDSEKIKSSINFETKFLKGLNTVLGILEKNINLIVHKSRKCGSKSGSTIVASMVWGIYLITACRGLSLTIPRR